MAIKSSGLNAKLKKKKKKKSAVSLPLLDFVLVSPCGIADSIFHYRMPGIAHKQNLDNADYYCKWNYRAFHLCNLKALMFCVEFVCKSIIGSASDSAAWGKNLCTSCQNAGVNNSFLILKCFMIFCIYLVTCENTVKFKCVHSMYDFVRPNDINSVAKIKWNYTLPVKWLVVLFKRSIKISFISLYAKSYVGQIGDPCT